MNIFANEFKKILFACIDLLENQELNNKTAAGLDNIIRYTCYTNLCYIDVYKLVSLLRREWADINVFAEYKYYMIDKDKLDNIKYDIMLDEMDKKWELLKEFNDLKGKISSLDARDKLRIVTAAQ